jgi:hypothetical protein
LNYEIDAIILGVGSTLKVKIIDARPSEADDPLADRIFRRGFGSILPDFENNGMPLGSIFWVEPWRDRKRYEW